MVQSVFIAENTGNVSAICTVPHKYEYVRVQQIQSPLHQAALFYGTGFLPTIRADLNVLTFQYRVLVLNKTWLLTFDIARIAQQTDFCVA